MPKDHVMIDLETMGTGFNAAIVSIGAVKFSLDPREEVTGDEFYSNILLQSCLNEGLSVDGSTIMWWLQQSEAARNVLKDKPKLLISALNDFYSWIKETDIQGIWSHKEFDSVILTNAMKVSNVSLPWSHKIVYDLRTLRFLYPELYNKAYETIENLNPHNALADAVKQAEIVRYVMARRFIVSDSDEKLYGKDIVDWKQ